MKKKTVIVGGTSKVFSPTSPISLSSPIFYRHFTSENVDLVPSGSSEFLVSFNHNPKLYRQFLKYGGTRDQAVLIRLEPDSVFPAQYTSRITSKYGLVISPGSCLTPAQNSFQVGWPYQYHLNPSKPDSSDPDLVEMLNRKDRNTLFSAKNWEKRSHLLTMVAGNKVSSISKANYSLRRNLAYSLPKEVLGVYGPLWQGPIYPKIRHRLAVTVATLKQGTLPNPLELYGSLLRTYATAKGTVENKHLLLQDSKFSLVIENSNSIMTEKIFDAIVNGSIPLYVGPALKSLGLPTDIAIQVKGNPEEILEIIEGIDSHQARKYLFVISEFLKNPSFLENWGAESVYRKIASRVNQYVEEVEE